jgi:16S rRNA processing protein RimM
MTRPPAPETRVIVGRVAGLYGVRGWVKVRSDTRPREGILNYNPWRMKLGGEWKEMRLAEGRAHGEGIIARLEGYTDRDRAGELIGAEIAVDRAQLPPARPGEYYWSDLVGLRVLTLDGTELGTVDHLLETGANDVLVVQGERERLLPWIGSVVREVDLGAGVIRVDWDPAD